MRRWLAVSAALVAAGAVVYWGLTRPTPVSAEALAGIEPDLARGEHVFNAGGCAACHMAEGADGDGPPVLSGGKRFRSPYGTFVAPNISPHPEHGIGGWTDTEIVSAVMAGVSPDGSHYFPAFPYPAYARAEIADVVSLAAYLRTLPESDRQNDPHEIAFPYNIRRNLGLWKRFFLDTGWVMADGAAAGHERGRYLVEALSHCGECHTPRNALGALRTDRWLGGAPNPAGDGNIPNITPAELTWSQGDLVEYFTSGFTPDFDTAGGAMAEVVGTLSKLPEEDRAAIAAYVKAVPPVE